jgi:hypothetical protein
MSTTPSIDDLRKNETNACQVYSLAHCALQDLAANGVWIDHDRPLPGYTAAHARCQDTKEAWKYAKRAVHAHPDYVASEGERAAQWREQQDQARVDRQNQARAASWAKEQAWRAANPAKVS